MWWRIGGDFSTQSGLRESVAKLDVKLKITYKIYNMVEIEWNEQQTSDSGFVVEYADL